MKDLEVIKYLLEEMENAIDYKNFYEEKICEVKKIAKKRNVWLGIEIREEFGIEKQPDYALIKQNSMKMRKILLKLY